MASLRVTEDEREVSERAVEEKGGTEEGRTLVVKQNCDLVLGDMLCALSSTSAV